MAKFINLIKLSVGTDSVEDLQAWQDSPRPKGADGLPRHVTRMWPRREDDILNGGSIYWVIKGVVQVRQRILRLDEYDRGDGIRRCALVFDPKLIRTEPALRRPFQGWRYLEPAEAPSDLTQTRGREENIPAQLAAALAEIGVR